MEQEENSRRLTVIIILCQCIGITNIATIPNVAFSEGVLGCIIFFTLTYVILGIPLLYMETVISQFTGRDCIDVWKISPCTSHVGYFLIAWQVVVLIYNHTVTSFLMHYFLISFESLLPYHTCGPWTNELCNIILTNFTVNKNCVRKQKGAAYCEGLYSTFPEYQYWRYNLVKLDRKLDIAWKVTLGSAAICVIVYVSCFKREKSLKWATYILGPFPIIAYCVLLTGSLLQKGIVLKFTEALDFEFKDFSKKFRISSIIHRVGFNLGIGSGVTFNLSANSSFRTPCLSNTVISVIICTLFSILTVITTAMMTCPYALEFDEKPEMIMKTRISFLFEKVPRLFNQYERKSFYLILTYSCYSVLGTCTNVIIFYNLLDVASTRSMKVAKYPGLTCFCGCILLFLITIPLFNYYGINIMTVSFRRHVVTFMTFISMIECVVFLTWYGVQRFSEDVHFMLGVQPKMFMKVTWLFSSVVLLYSFFVELNHHLKTTTQFIYGSYVTLAVIGVLIAIFVVKCLYAACTKQMSKMFQLDPSWGPRNEVLQRSRAMFSAQAMTKEYMYRQYHLQAGILSRQRQSNVRNSTNIV
ncbi:unnamed protein product [Leptosia nina]|uniref:Uncharacterized protein n=1 Tax=Leptosia nina TaxID=320188 RepID=A0AAV1JX31_9NEOP